MNRNTSKKTGGCKAAKLPTAQASIVLTIPNDFAPLLAACAAAVEMSTQEYVKQSIFAAMRCDADIIHSGILATIKQFEGGQS